jgi:hypothetical protein
VAEAGRKAEDQVERAFQLALCRPARADELRAALEFLGREERQIMADAGSAKAEAAPEAHDARRRALESFCLVLFNMNEFVYNN